MRDRPSRNVAKTPLAYFLFRRSGISPVRPILCSLYAASFLIARSFAADGEKPADPAPQVVVVGNCRVPGAIPFTEGMTVSQAIVRSGGTVDFAAARVFLIRNAQSTKVALREILDKSNPEKDVVLKPWDIIYIR